MPVKVSAADDEIGFADLITRIQEFYRKTILNRAMIVRMVTVSFAIGLVFAFGGDKEYVAHTRLVPYKGAVTAGGLSGLAGIAGIRLPVGAVDQIITADLYPEVASSQDFRVVVAETPLAFESLSKKATIIEYFGEIKKQSLLELVADNTVGMPRKIQNILYQPYRANSIEKISDEESTGLLSYSREYIKLINTLETRLSVSVDKKTSIITITGTMPDRYAAADLVKTVSGQLMDRIIDYESRKAAEQFKFVNTQFNIAKSRYERAQRELALFSDRNRSLMSAAAQIDRDRLQRENDMTFEVYQQFGRELEQARIKMSQDTPVFTVLERVTVPVTHASPKRLRILLVSVFLGFLAGAARFTLAQITAAHS